MNIFHCTVKHADCGGRCEYIDTVLRYLAVINDETRLRIICVLSNTRGYSVNEISEGVELHQNLVSHHLKSMFSIGILSKEKVGLKIFYKLNQAKINNYNQELKILLNQSI